MPSVAKMIVPSIINGHSHEGQPGQADIAAKSRNDVNDRSVVPLDRNPLPAIHD
jgi:hypothetical protein